MNGVKSIFASVTFWSSTFGLLGAVYPKALMILGLNSTNQDAVIGLIVAIVGWAGAVYGRLHVTRVATLTGNPPKD
jgi:hypothetical protein